MNLVFSSKVLILLIVWSSFFSFLYMNIYAFIIFLLSSFFLIIKENKYLLYVLGKYKFSLYYLFIYLIVFSLPFIIINNYSTAVYFLLTIWSIVLSIVFLKDINLEYFYFAIKYLFFTFTGITLLYIYSTVGMYEDAYRLDYMIDGKVSGNGVTSFLNILLGMYTALRMKLKNKSSILLTLLSLYIVIEGYGRGSILFVLILLIINLVFLFYSVNRKWKLFYIVLLCFVIIMFSPYIYDFLMSTKLSQGIQNPRIYIAQEYISKLHAWNLFFGVSYENTVIATLYDNNPHISYIRTHHIFGLFYLLGLLYVVLKQTFYVVFNRSLINWIILLIIYNILMRAVSEPLLFPSLFDSFFLVILFSITKKSTKENR